MSIAWLVLWMFPWDSAGVLEVLVCLFGVGVLRLALEVVVVLVVRAVVVVEDGEEALRVWAGLEVVVVVVVGVVELEFC